MIGAPIRGQNSLRENQGQFEKFDENRSRRKTHYDGTFCIWLTCETSRISTRIDEKKEG